MKPDLELVCVRGGESFAAWAHGYPYRTVRWHFHPEYEIQLITHTTGKYFVGDYIGDFEPGNLVMSGPNLPHNWISELPSNQPVRQRCLILQFSADFIGSAMRAFPELKQLQALLDESRRGLLFSAAAGEAAKPLMQELIEARGLRRVTLFMTLLELLLGDGKRRQLASADYLPDPHGYMSEKINLALAYIGKNLARELRETELAELTGQHPSSFSRSFRKHAGMSFVQYVNQLRIKMSCEMLSNSELSITDICYQVGFNNLSNFNRQFLAHKGIPPSTFRRYDGMKSAAPP
jgi:AraC-like DNA-binding protein